MEMQKRGLSYIRFNTEDFPLNAVSTVGEDYATLRLEKSSKEISLDNVESVWYRRPVAPGFTNDFEPGSKTFIARESSDFLLGIWRGLKCRWINHPDNLRLASGKVEKISDIRVTVVGSQVFATEIHSQSLASAQLDWRHDALNLRHTPYKLPDH